jgi:hypothetical protein
MAYNEVVNATLVTAQCISGQPHRCQWRMVASIYTLASIVGSLTNSQKIIGPQSYAE